MSCEKLPAIFDLVLTIDNDTYFVPMKVSPFPVWVGDIDETHLVFYAVDIKDCKQMKLAINCNNFKETFSPVSCSCKSGFSFNFGNIATPGCFRDAKEVYCQMKAANRFFTLSPGQSTSGGCCTSNVQVTLLSLGGAGCGIEVTNGVAYSIGSQNIDASYTGDICGCIAGVRINGSLVPTFVADGDIINVSLQLNNGCRLISATNPRCRQVMSFFMNAGRLFLNTMKRIIPVRWVKKKN